MGTRSALAWARCFNRGPTWGGEGGGGRKRYTKSRDCNSVAHALTREGGKGNLVEMEGGTGTDQIFKIFSEKITF